LIAYYTGQLDEAGKVEFDMYIRSKAGAMSQFACKSDRFVKSIVDKQAKLVPEVAELTENGAKFKDGSFYECDTILLCTGFEGKVNYLTLPNGEDVPCMSTMYKKTFIPHIGTSLAFVGFARPSIGAIPPIAELQARWLALLLSEQRHLPSQKDMMETVKFDNINHNFKRDGARPTLVNWIHFSDQLADLIGCRPDPWFLFRDPAFMWQLMTGPFVDCCYRISGPGKCPDIARDTMMRLPRGMPLVDLSIWTLWNAIAAVLRAYGVPGLQQWTTIL